MLKEHYFSHIATRNVLAKSTGMSLKLIIRNALQPPKSLVICQQTAQFALVMLGVVLHWMGVV